VKKVATGRTGIEGFSWAWRILSRTGNGLGLWMAFFLLAAAPVNAQMAPAGTETAPAVPAESAPAAPPAGDTSQPVAPAPPPAPAPAPAAMATQQPHYVGYTGIPWSRDFGVVGGRCDAASVRDAVGAPSGGRSIAIVAGATGEKLGRELDGRDRGCMGHALELVRKGSSVSWSNESTGVTYRLTLMRDFVEGSDPCREFVAEVSASGRKDSVKGGACRRREAEWEVLK